MELSKEQMKEQAIKILSHMGVRQYLISEFRDENIFPIFYRGFPFECNRQLVCENLVKNCFPISGLPYAMITGNTCGMDMYSFLMISPYQEDLSHMFRRTDDPNTFIVYAYCYNNDHPELSEPGSIIVKVERGFLKRVG